MLTLDGLIGKAQGKLKIYKDFRLQANKKITERLTICIPDMHLLERGPNDDFLDGKPEYEERVLSLLDFLWNLRQEEGEGLEVVQIGDMFDLWQAKGNTNMIFAAYPSIIGLLDKMKTIYIVGNHDIDLVRWYKDRGETFGRRWRYYSKAAGRLRAIYEHGFQADFSNHQDSLLAAIGREVTRIVGMGEYIYPDIDKIFDSTWGSVLRAFSKYNVFTPVRDPEGFNSHEYLKFYIHLLEKYNRGETLDHFGPKEVDLSLAVIGHTHTARLVKMPKKRKVYYLMDCGSWVNGGHEVGVISGKDMAICEWG